MIGIALHDIRSMTAAELSLLLEQMGQPRYRAKQLYKWLQQGVDSYDSMTDLPKSLREKLAAECYISSPKIVERLCSAIDETKKYLIAMHDGELVEAVLMKYNHGYSVCISTQVGCKMGCVFCATGRSGFSRDLTASEMLGQITAIRDREEIRISNVVLMGMGEPLDNFDNVMRFLELVSDEEGVCIGQRHISVSTCGLVDRIEQLIPMKPQFTLSVSLHAPNDRIRDPMMPVTRRWNVSQLLAACRRYADATGRRISFEYSLVSGQNDSDECARELASKLRGMLCHVNLIPDNTVDGTGCHEPDKQRIRSFCDLLNGAGITATVRRTLGSDINASCGQLRRRKQQGEQ